jgi:hypothetical protein
MRVDVRHHHRFTVKQTSIHFETGSGGNRRTTFLFREKSYDGQMRVWHEHSYSYLEIGFSTNPDGIRRCTFSAGIGPDKFEELARLMVEAEAQGAIRAFGAALQAVEIQKRETDSSGAVAA